MGKRRGKGSRQREYLARRLHSAMLLAQADMRREEEHDRLQYTELLERRREDRRSSATEIKCTASGISGFDCGNLFAYASALFWTGERLQLFA